MLASRLWMGLAAAAVAREGAPELHTDPRAIARALNQQLRDPEQAKQVVSLPAGSVPGAAPVARGRGGRHSQGTAGPRCSITSRPIRCKELATLGRRPGAAPPAGGRCRDGAAGRRRPHPAPRGVGRERPGHPPGDAPAAHQAGLPGGEGQPAGAGGSRSGAARGGAAAGRPLDASTIPTRRPTPGCWSGCPAIPGGRRRRRRSHSLPRRSGWCRCRWRPTRWATRSGPRWRNWCARGAAAEVVAMVEDPHVAEDIAEHFWLHLATPANMRILLSNEPRDTEVVELLLERMGMAAAEPMLESLEVADNRAMRRRLLTRLGKLGPAIGPDARSSGCRGAPWYVQRNLLALLGSPAGGAGGLHPRARMPTATTPGSGGRRIKLMLRIPGQRDEAILASLGDDDDANVRHGSRRRARRLPARGGGPGCWTLLNDRRLSVELRVAGHPGARHHRTRGHPRLAGEPRADQAGLVPQTPADAQEPRAAGHSRVPGAGLPEGPARPAGPAAGRGEQRSRDPARRHRRRWRSA